MQEFKKNENRLHDEKDKTDNLFKTLSEMPSDFYIDERIDEPPQEREEF